MVLLIKKQENEHNLILRLIYRTIRYITKWDVYFHIYFKENNSALFVALVAQDGFEKRGGDARFATGVMGSSFNRIGKSLTVVIKSDLKSDFR